MLGGGDELHQMRIEGGHTRKLFGGRRNCGRKSSKNHLPMRGGEAAGQEINGGSSKGGRWRGNPLPQGGGLKVHN